MIFANVSKGSKAAGQRPDPAAEIILNAVHYAWHRLYNGWDVKGDAALGDVLRQLRLCFPAVLLKEGPLAFLCASSGVKYSGPHSIEPEIGLRVPRNQAPCELHRLQPEENHDA